ncbi:ATP-binding cassette domain-containing protein [Arcanobacterium hippocoleae]|uniref:ATP-binding cassette domain-containing protein n=1 Tax=Arcanobacterium hippocoleae TaxID=149017 RepID=UPI003340A8F9
MLLDGTNTRTMAKSDLRSHMGIVLQDTWLFEGTIRENLAFGADDPSDEQIFAAAKATGIDRLIRQLPEGYNTVLDADATVLSAGEKQLLTIARAYISQPEILILDEATSSVDTRTEMLVQNAMNQLRIGRTSFIIAHRLSTIRDADLIIVMVDGDVVEQGTHDSLLAAKGAYAKLYQAQFAGADSVPGTTEE